MALYCAGLCPLWNSTPWCQRKIGTAFYSKNCLSVLTCLEDTWRPDTMHVSLFFWTWILQCVENLQQACLKFTGKANENLQSPGAKLQLKRTIQHRKPRRKNLRRDFLQKIRAFKNICLFWRILKVTYIPGAWCMHTKIQENPETLTNV